MSIFERIINRKSIGDYFFTQAEIRAMFWKCQFVGDLQSENEAIK
jgi:hypothetical protein